MKPIKFILFVFSLMLIYTPMAAQSVTDELKPYFLVLLKAGPERNQDSVTAAQIQKQHLEYINAIAQTGKLNVAGPCLDNSYLRGIFILDVPTEAEAKQLCEADPAVKSGRLNYEIHPWMTQKGVCFK